MGGALRGSRCASPRCYNRTFASSHPDWEDSVVKIYEPPASTGAETIKRYGELADRGGDAEVAAQAWTKAGFDDETTAKWLESRCFDPGAARALAELGVTPGQAGARTRDGPGNYIDTIGHKVANGDLTARQGAARCLSSR